MLRLVPIFKGQGFRWPLRNGDALEVWLRDELVARGHGQTERFSVARSATEMAALYRQLAAEGPSS